jgi:hypothetical protein
MATNASPFIVNIVPLQNITTDLGASGGDTAVLQAQITSLQTMVDTTTHTIYTDSIRSFTTDGTIDIFANLNLSNSSLLTNSNTTASSSGSSSLIKGTSTIGVSGSTIVTFASPFTATPIVTGTFLGANPIFITLQSISQTSFLAYAWSNNSLYTSGSANFSWMANAST